MFVVDNMKMRQQGEDHGNKLEFQFNLRRLFISVLLSSTLVTGEYLERAKSLSRRELENEPGKFAF